MTSGDDGRCHSARSPTTQGAGLKSTVNDGAGRSCANRDIVKQGIGRVTDIIVVVIEERERVAVTAS